MVRRDGVVGDYKDEYNVLAANMLAWLKSDDRDGSVLTEADEAEVQPRLERSWSEKYDVPSQAPGFEGATPQALAKALSVDPTGQEARYQLRSRG